MYGSFTKTLLILIIDKVQAQNFSSSSLENSLEIWTKVYVPGYFQHLIPVERNRNATLHYNKQCASNFVAVVIALNPLPLII